MFWLAERWKAENPISRSQTSPCFVGLFYDFSLLLPTQLPNFPGSRPGKKGVTHCCRRKKRWENNWEREREGGRRKIQNENSDPAADWVWLKEQSLERSIINAFKAIKRQVSNLKSRCLPAMWLLLAFTTALFFGVCVWVLVWVEVLAVVNVTRRGPGSGRFSQGEKYTWKLYHPPAIAARRGWKSASKYLV